MNNKRPLEERAVSARFLRVYWEYVCSHVVGEKQQNEITTEGLVHGQLGSDVNNNNEEPSPWSKARGARL